MEAAPGLAAGDLSDRTAVAERPRIRKVANRVLILDPDPETRDNIYLIIV